MSTEIYTFSGTGNSLSVARDLAAQLGARLRSIPRLMERVIVSSDADAVGLVFPVYHKSIPLILKRFIQKLKGLEDAYVFGVCTYGDSPGLALEHVNELVGARGAALAAGFGIHMPYNYLTPSPRLRRFLRSFTLREVGLEKQRALLAGADEKVEQIAAAVRAREADTWETTSDVLTRLADRLDLPERVAKGVWLRVAGVTEATELSFIESRQLMDRAFTADAMCNGCSVCSKICPVTNIAMVNGRPVWQQWCEQCFGCLHWCPEQAIQFGSGTAGRRRYHHPDVTLSDMLSAAPQG